MKERHEKELASIDTGVAGTKSAPKDSLEPEVQAEDTQLTEKERKLEKARRKRAKQREKEQRREKEIEEETAKAGPAPRDVENDIINQQLTPLSMEIAEVEADGHCLYRAVAAQTDSDYIATSTSIVRLVYWLKIQSLIMFYSVANKRRSVRPNPSGEHGRVRTIL